MNKRSQQILFLLLKLIILGLFLAPFCEKAMALGEIFNSYDSPLGLAMGNAYTANAMGGNAIFYNPANLGKATKDEWQLVPIELDGITNSAGITEDLGAGGFDIYKLMSQMQNHPGAYNYFRLNALSSFTRRDMGIAFLGSSYYAATSDGTNIDIRAGQDIGVYPSAAINLIGNELLIGVTGKVLLRDQLLGTFPVSQFTSDASVNSAMQEGIGVGADIGLTATLPIRYFPTASVVVHDVTGTTFTASHVLNSTASGAPPPIGRDYNFALSLNPILSKAWRATIAVEYDDISAWAIPWQKHFHAGIQVVNGRHLYLWAGLNQLYFTLGVGYHIAWGDLDLGTYAEDIGTGSAFQQDRRFFIRYTIGFD